MSTFPSIRQNRRLTAGGLWQTVSDKRPTTLRQVEKAQQTGLYSRLASVCQLSEDPNLGAKPHRRRRRAMARTYIALTFGLALAGCNTPPQAAPSVAGEVCRADDPAWTTCMLRRKPGRHPPAQLLFTDWRD